MYFGYPVQATLNNWLHECLCTAVRNIHALADGRKRYPKWPTILPPLHSAQLAAKAGLRDRFRAYNQVVRRLGQKDRDLILRALDEENRIADLLQGKCDCLIVDDLPVSVRVPIAELFGFGFSLLTDLGVRDDFYTHIHAQVKFAACPFCGVARFAQPGGPREALDHYLAKRYYAFAAANLRNLVPMCDGCNSRYKLSQDLLRSADGTRRCAFDPYAHGEIALNLDGSLPFRDSLSHTPDWKVEFVPDSPEAATWNEVFAIRTRYMGDHLPSDYENWLTDFQEWARDAGIDGASDKTLIDGLRRYHRLIAQMGFRDRAYLKAAVLRMLLLHCESGDSRLLGMLRNLIAPVTPAP